MLRSVRWTPLAVPYERRGVPSGRNEGSDVKPPAVLAEALDAVLEPWNRADQPGLAAAVESAEGWTWRRAVGSADVQAGVANTVRTGFRIGSITKQLMCAIVFDLAEKGLIDLDASVRHYLPELDPWFEPVKVLNLTDHTSGIWCHITTSLLVNGRGLYPPPSDREVFELVAGQRSASFPVGAHMSYSNGGSLLLSRLVERVEGRGLEEVFEDRLFGPIGMTSSGLMRCDSDMEPGVAMTHTPLPDGRCQRGYMPFPMGGEGGAVSTLDDMLAWLRHLDAPHAFSADVVGRMDAPVPLASGFVPNFRRGLMHASYRGVEMIFHDGGVIGGLARAARLPALGLNLVVLTNRGDVPVNLVGRRLIDALAGDRLEPAPIPPRQFWQGTFHEPGSARLYRFELRDGAPMVDMSGTPVLLVEDGTGQKCDSAETCDIAFSLSDDVLTVHDRGVDRTCRRLAPDYWPSDGEGRALAGRYHCLDLRTDAIVSVTDEGAELEMRGPLGMRRYRLSPEARNVWRLAPTDPPSSRASEPVLEVVEGPEGVSGFRIGQFRATVDFARII